MNRGGLSEELYQYHQARREYAFHLRCQGMILSEIGKRLGITKERARCKIMDYERRDIPRLRG
jgi:hypothetical protein